MSGFKDYLGKKKRDKVLLSKEEQTYVDKIVSTVESNINTKDPIDDTLISTLVEESFRLILNQEMETIERQLRSSVLYATDRLKDKYRNLINKSIIHGDKNNEYNSGSTKDSSRKSI